jgi:hypothetical protein
MSGSKLEIAKLFADVEMYVLIGYDSVIIVCGRRQQ